MAISMVIEKPYCDWISVAMRDKRKGFIWLCRECRARGKGRKVPKCPCVKIEIGKLDGGAGE